MNEKQTKQFGARNEGATTKIQRTTTRPAAWIAIDEARAEVSYLRGEASQDTADLETMLGSALAALDAYLALAPPSVREEAVRRR